MTGTIEFPRRRAGQFSPPDEYARLRDRPGLVRSALPNGSTVWLVSRHEDVRAVLTDRRISASPLRDGFPTIGTNGTVPSPEAIPGWFVAYDPPEHARFRKALVQEFTVRRIAELAGAVRRTVDARIDAMLDAGRRADLVADFALPVPSTVICHLLGVPYHDHELFESRTRTLVTFTSTDQERALATNELLVYISKLVAVKARFPGNDLISRALAKDALTPRELEGVALLLLIAGHETTANNIALGALMLMLNPQWIGSDGVVEEVLRYLSVADRVALRVAVEDVEIGGQLIRAGEGIVPLGAAANHDEREFARAAEFDPSRSGGHHVAFGFGIHQCLGQHLVRLEMTEAFGALFTRIPGLTLDRPVEDLPVKHDGVIFGLRELPVRW